MPVKSFKGKLEDGQQDVIALSTNNGLTGYRITKFQLMMEQPGNTAQESLVQIWKVRQSSVPTSNATVDFTDHSLLAAAFLDTNVHPTNVIIFDNEVFNQDIYVTYTDNGGGTNEDINYYIELEQIKLDLTEQTVATLQSIRTSAQGTGQKG